MKRTCRLACVDLLCRLACGDLGTSASAKLWLSSVDIDDGASFRQSSPPLRIKHLTRWPGGQVAWPRPSPGAGVDPSDLRHAALGTTGAQPGWESHGTRPLCLGAGDGGLMRFGMLDGTCRSMGAPRARGAPAGVAGVAGRGRGRSGALRGAHVLSCTLVCHCS